MKILIVDDEWIERDAIRFLIRTHNIDLDVAEAENGEKALEIIRNVFVDILFTDIKMPLMNGLELAAKARILNPDIKIIIISAYSEPEYVREAIKLNVDYYIHKPINIDEFIRTMSEVILACEVQQKKNKNEEECLQLYQKVKVHDTERILLGILRGNAPDEDIEVTIHNGITGMSLKDIRMILLDFKDRFFDSKKLDFGKDLDNIIKCGFCIVNINEYRTVIFLQEPNREKTYLESIGRQLLDVINLHYEKDVCIVFSRKIADIKDIYTEYTEVDRLVEYKFFFKGSVTLFAGESMYNGNAIPESVDEVIENINKFIVSNDFVSAEDSFEMFISNARNTGHFSNVYMKYICMEMLKKILKCMDQGNVQSLWEAIERVEKAVNIFQLRDAMMSIIEEIKLNSAAISAKYKRAVADVIHIIQREYDKDISLEYLAKKVFLTPSYLNCLFREETGRNTMQYITNYRLEEAKKLLKDTNMKIADISKSVGYINPSYFCSLFKNYYGTPPGQYRERIE